MISTQDRPEPAVPAEPAEEAPAMTAYEREGPLAGTGNDPIALWILGIFGVAMLVAGGVLGSAGRLFDYQSTIRAGYLRKPAPGSADQGPPPKDALTAYMARGSSVYAKKCIVCHGPEAKGDGANYPSLVGSKWATGETERMAMIVLNGLQGPMSSGKTYGAGMPTQALGLTPEDLAGVMTYVRNNFGNQTGDVVTVEMAKKAFEISAAREKAGQPTSGSELEADHLKPLPGKTLEPKALVNPITLLPVPVGKKS